MILSIDPSASCVGWTWLDESERIVGFGHRAKKTLLGEPEDVSDTCYAAIAEIIQQGNDEQWTAQLRHVVIETPQTFMVRSKGTRSATTLPTYGRAVGIFEGYCHSWRDHTPHYFQIHGVSASEWARGYKVPHGDNNKDSRVRALAFLTGQQLDLGPKTHAGNVADAALMGLWWLRRDKAKEKVKQ